MAETIDTCEKVALALQGLWPDGVPTDKLPIGLESTVTNRAALASAWQGNDAPTLAELREGLRLYEQQRDWRVETRTARQALRDAWEVLPPYIRGPFRHKFKEAEKLLDAGDYAAARAVIEFADAPADYDATQLATFAAVKLQMLAGIDALPAMPVAP